MSHDSATPRSGKAPLRVKCPTCGTEAVYEGNPWRPFCSERCLVIDRGRWAGEEYSLPSEDSAPEPPSDED